MRLRVRSINVTEEAHAWVENQAKRRGMTMGELASAVLVKTLEGWATPRERQRMRVRAIRKSA